MRDTLDDGRPFRILAVVDTFTRERPLLAADTSLTGKRVAELLDGIAVEQGYPNPATARRPCSLAARAIPADVAGRPPPLAEDLGVAWRGAASRGWLTEGFDAADLVEAASLLAQLS